MIEGNMINKTIKRHILKDVSFTLHDGSLTALIGPSRAGKTTLIKIIAGIYQQDSGTVLMDEASVFENAAAKQRIAHMISDLTYPGAMTLKKLSHQMRNYYPEFYETRYQELITRCHLEEMKKYRKASREERILWQAVLALSLMPAVLLIDLKKDDRAVLQAYDVWTMIEEDMKNRQMSVLVTGNSVKEFTTCDQVMLMKKGKIVFSENLMSHDDRVHKVKVSYAPEQAHDYDGLRVLYEETNDDHDVIIVENTLSDIHDRLMTGNVQSCAYLPLTLEEFFMFELGGESDGFKEFIF